MMHFKKQARRFAPSVPIIFSSASVGQVDGQSEDAVGVAEEEMRNSLAMRPEGNNVSARYVASDTSDSAPLLAAQIPSFGDRHTGSPSEFRSASVPAMSPSHESNMSDKRRFRSKFVPPAIIAALLGGLIQGPTDALAASDYVGRIGRIDVRTGHADKTVYRNGIVVRDEGQSVVCVVAPGIENHDQFVSMATAAMLAGKTVRLERGGELNGQFKCYEMQVIN